MADHSPNRPTGMLHEPSDSRSRLVVRTSLVLFALAAIGVFLRWSQLLHNPQTAYLAEDDAAPWIRHDRPFHLVANPSLRAVNMFRCNVRIDRPEQGLRLRVRAFRRFAVWLDQDIERDEPLYITRSVGDWKSPRTIPLPDLTTPGEHSLYVLVENEAGPACLSAECRAVNVRTGLHWQVHQSDRSWGPVALASQPPSLELADLYPTVPVAIFQIWPSLLPVFCAVFLLSLNSRRLPFLRWLTPSMLRFGLLAGWFVLSANNLMTVDSRIGFDVKGHVDYIHYVATRHRIPLASDGWQMFQSPLFYIVSAPFYALFSAFTDSATCTRFLRFLPMLCGALQIEVCFRAARYVFPDRPDLQRLATLIGGMLPVNLYSSQFVGNEPLAGILTASTILFCFSLICAPQRPRSTAHYLRGGAVWGLAVLAKVTPILLAPLLVAAIAYRGWIARSPARRTVREAAAVVGAASLLAGWYYVRNMVYLGRPFVGGWDSSRGIGWWQDPGYRNWSQLMSFGDCLQRPVYSGRWGLADSLYSTFWTDGFLSGTILPPDSIPWNIPWLVALAWLGMVPLACIVMGAALCVREPETATRDSLLFSLAVVGVYLFAIIDLWIQLPIYSTGKATYMIGAVPCLSLLAAAGARPLLKHDWTRAFLTATLACWIVAGFTAFFASPDKRIPEFRNAARAAGVWNYADASVRCTRLFNQRPYNG